MIQITPQMHVLVAVECFIAKFALA